MHIAVVALAKVGMTLRSAIAADAFGWMKKAVEPLVGSVGPVDEQGHGQSPYHRNVVVPTLTSIF